MYFKEGKRQLGTEEDSIKRYQDTLKAYQESQQMLTDMGLPEETQNPVEDMVNQANQEAELADAEMARLNAAEKRARLLEKKSKLDNNLYSDVNMTPEEKETAMSNIENSVKSGTLGKDDEDVLKSLKEGSTEPGTATVEDVLEPAPQPGIPASEIAADFPDEPVSRRQQLLDRLAEARRERSMQEAIADITEGGSRYLAGSAGGGLVALKPDTKYADLLRKRAERGVTEAQADIEQLGKTEAETRKSRLDDLNLRYKKAQINSLVNKKDNQLSSDASSNSSVAARERYKKMYPGFTFEGLSEKDISDNIKNMIANKRIEEYYKPKTEISKDRLTATERERARKWFNDNQEDLKKNVDKFNADKEVVRANSMISGASIARDMANSDNPIADASIPNFLARASGEVGALTEADKEPFGGSRAIQERIKQITKQFADGKLTEANRRFVIDLAKVYENTAMKVKEKRARDRASQYGGIDFSRDMLVNKFLGLDPTFGFTLDEKDASSTFSDVGKKARTVVKKGYNPKTNQTQFIYSDGTKEIVEGRK